MGVAAIKLGGAERFVNDDSIRSVTGLRSALFSGQQDAFDATQVPNGFNLFELGALGEQGGYGGGLAVRHFQSEPAAGEEAVAGLRDERAVEPEAVGSSVQSKVGFEITDFGLEAR